MLFVVKLGSCGWICLAFDDVYCETPVGFLGFSGFFGFFGFKWVYLGFRFVNFSPFVCMCVWV